MLFRQGVNTAKARSGGQETFGEQDLYSGFFEPE